MNENIEIKISKKLLSDIEDNIKGNSQEAKLLACIQKGFESLTETP